MSFLKLFQNCIIYGQNGMNVMMLQQLYLYSFIVMHMYPTLFYICNKLIDINLYIWCNLFDI
jgi:hypothetical protein